MARQVAQPLFLWCRIPSRECGRLPARHRGRLPYGAGPRFAGPSLDDSHRQPSSWQAARIGRRAEPRRRPGAGGAFVSRPRAPHPAPSPRRL